jgi:N-acetylmuramoyl-L-alanine amidase
VRTLWSRRFPFLAVLAGLVAAVSSLAAPPQGVVAATGLVRELSVSGSPFAADLPPLPTGLTTTLQLRLRAHVTLTVTTAGGEMVDTILADRRVGRGQHTYTWSGTDSGGHAVADGVYGISAVARRGGRQQVIEREVRKGLPPIYPANPGAIVIAVDPGHGGPYGGALDFGYAEKGFNLDIGLKLRDLLEQAGVQVAMSRTTNVRLNEPPADHNGDGRIDVYDDLALRNDNANQARADINIAIHNNGSVARDRTGTEVFTSKRRGWTAQGAVLARDLVDQEYAAVAPYTTPTWAPIDRGAKWGSYYCMDPYGTHKGRPLVRPTLMPTVLSESLYMSNRAEFEMLLRPDVRTSIAAGMYLGIAEYLNSRAYGVRYDLVDAPSGAVAPGSSISYRIRVTNRGNVASSGWRLVLGFVPAVPVYDGSGGPGVGIGTSAVPDGLAPGHSVTLDVAATAPAVAGHWLVKSDIRLGDDSLLSTIGVVPLQVHLLTN